MSSQEREEGPPTALLADTLDHSTALPQTQSPLFTIVPPEIRNRIFSLALRSYDDKANPYEKGTERLYWWGRGPTPELTCCNPVDDLRKMTPAHRSRAAIHIFVQQFRLEGPLKRIFLDSNFRPARLKLTLRHTDWWNWEQSRPLCLDPKQPGQPSRANYVAPHQPFNSWSWGVCLASINGLQTFVLELETVNTKKNELDDIVHRAQDWVFPMHDGAFLICDPLSRKVTTWKGIDRFYELSQETWRPAGRGEGDAPELTYYVVELMWRRTERDPAKDKFGEEWSTTTHRGIALTPLPPPEEEDESFGLFD
ncbi:MAG: hypothetical protein Q9160_004494 [Pyrenula sp. 1 TL-2023]